MLIPGERPLVRERGMGFSGLCLGDGWCWVKALPAQGELAVHEAWKSLVDMARGEVLLSYALSYK